MLLDPDVVKALAVGRDIRCQYAADSSNPVRGRWPLEAGSVAAASCSSVASLRSMFVSIAIYCTNSRTAIYAYRSARAA